MALMTRNEIAELGSRDRNYAAVVREEQTLARRLVRQAIAKGWYISVNDGEETTLKDSSNAKAILNATRTTDEDYLTFRGEGGTKIGWALLVWGNGEDVIADCSPGEVEKLVNEVTGEGGVDNGHVECKTRDWEGC